MLEIISKGFLQLCIILMLAANNDLFAAFGVNFYFNLVVILLLLFLELFSLRKYSLFLTHLWLFNISFFIVNISINNRETASYSNLITFVLVTLCISLFKKIKLTERQMLLSLLVGIILSAIRVLSLNTELLVESLATSNRFKANFVGAVNNFSYLLTFGVAITIFYVGNKATRTTLLFFLVPLNLLTLSRGGNLSMVILFAYLFLSRFSIKTAAIYFTILAGLFYFIPSSYYEGYVSLFTTRYDLSETEGGAGRSIIWEKVIELLDTPLKVLFGVGSGSFRFGDDEVSTHNQYLDFFYSFGVLGLLYFISQYFYVIYRLARSYKANEPIIIFHVLYLISFLFDSRLWVIQTFWIFSMVVGISLKKIESDDNASRIYSNRKAHV